MVYELPPRDYDRVAHLFEPLAQRPFCAAVLAGVEAGRVFVDDPSAPRTALLVTRDVWGYLAGAPDNDAFNRALNAAIYGRQVVGQEVPLLQLTCHPEAWYGQLAVVTHPRKPIAEIRRFYVGRRVTYDWQGSVPVGLVLQQIDEILGERLVGPLPEDVDRLLALRAAAADPDRAGFGFVALHGERVAAYAMVDCVVGEVGEIFLFTDESYRRRGLATLTTAATIAYGLAHGLSQVNWDCAADNEGSWRTAERLGLSLEGEYTMHYFWLG